MKKFIWASGLLALWAGSTAHAADDWWFDVEVIIFDRNQSVSQLDEKFDGESSLAPSTASLNLIDEYLRPNISFLKQGLATCGRPANPLWVQRPTTEQIISDYKAWQSSQPVYDSAADSESMSAEAPTSLTATDEPITPAYSDGDAPDEQLYGEAQSADEYGMVEMEDTNVAAPFVPVTDEEIAGYWVAFTGLNDYQPVAVPGFSYCETPVDWLTYKNHQWQVNYPDNALPAPDHVPEFLDGRDWSRSPVAHLLPYDNLELTKLSRQIRQTRGLNRMLHIAWRQEVKVGEKNAEAVRIIAGDNYAENFRADGSAIKPVPLPVNATLQNDDDALTLTEDAFFTDLEARLAAPQYVDFSTLMQASDDATTPDISSIAEANEGMHRAIWQLDGFLKVYLKYINRVPYLHIDSELQYRQPVSVDSDTASQPEFELVSVPFKQVRRVISKQIHYFDHPMFGMVVEIRRYQRPKE